TLVLVEIRYHCSWRGFLSSRLNLEESILFFFCFHNPFLWEFVGVGGPRPYGYHYILDEKGKKAGLELNHDIIHIEPDGTKWTEVAVISFIFESVAAGVPIGQVAVTLNEKGIPTANKIRKTRFRDQDRIVNAAWQKSTIDTKLHDSAYWGEYRQFKYKTGEKLPGRKHKQILKAPEDQQIIIPVPAIVSQETAQAVQRILQLNQQRAARNNKHPEATLLRSGYIKCGECGYNMAVAQRHDTWKGKRYCSWQYRCSQYTGRNGQHGQRLCKCVTIAAKKIDDAAWQFALEIVNDPPKLEKKLSAWKKKDPTAENRKNIKEKLKEIRGFQANLQAQLAKEMMEGTLTRKTKEFLASQLRQLEEQERQWETKQAKEELSHETWEIAEKKIKELEKECVTIREKLDDPAYQVTYKTKRDLIERLGVTVTVWQADHMPPYRIECLPPDIESLIC
ncbi:MAG TPA: recombinase family protein, partial [Ktedonobacteraceae bacterium]